ncbi:unnamed protein product [Adineta steineri]|uniref:Uncharacterized protein n=1 Tax=Adineta steineri TaxID=433720 RepID=A0A818M4K1_9BILA|nr:unnamed protein product [Adineta steineri]CAF3579195.1 unnamed protein product [Adineta steineri]
MIDPRYANAGGIPLAPGGYGAQQVPAQYHHHRHHRHHKHKVRNDASPISLDESIHKVEHGHRHHHNHHHHFQPNDGVPVGGGYGVPYGAAGGYHQPQQQQQQQQPQFVGNNYAYGNHFQGAAYGVGGGGGQGPFGVGPAGQLVKRRRRHHRHHRHHTADGGNPVPGLELEQAVPEQLIGQRSSSVLGDEGQNIRSPVPTNDDKASEGQIIHHRRHRRHHHHHHNNHNNNNSEQAGFGQSSHQSRHGYGNTSVGADGYGHINEDLIFIERGDHSPHRQEPPPGYEYKGKIEVQGINKEARSASRGASSNAQPCMPVHQPAQQPSSGPCPPGWQQMILSPAPGGPCPTGGLPYTGQLLGTGGYQASSGGYGSAYGTTSSGGAYSNYGTNPAAGYSSQCQIVADYIFGPNSGGSTSGGYQQVSGSGCGDYQNQQALEHVTTRPTIIEVWQKRNKSETRERSRSRSHHRSRTPAEGPGFDFDRFRDEILAAIERIVPRGGQAPDIQWVGRDGGTQTQIHPGESKVEERRPSGSGEVRVIVQPIQPVFYMPRQTGGTPTPQIGPAPVQQAPAGAPHVVYVPRNVYVPVIKPVFVPRERVIIRPQVIHVARPVLVDRPVPVTQRPIIIDRERPIPVPVREGQSAVQGGGSKVVREEYVYRDNVPVAYGGRCAEFAGGVNYGYMPTQQEHQYANSSTHEVSNIYQTQGEGVNVNVPTEYQHSQSSSHVELQQGGEGSFHGSYSNLAAQRGQQQYATSSTHEVTGGGDSSFHGSYSNLSGINNATAANVAHRNQEVLRQTFQQSAEAAGIPANCPTQIEVLDTAVNPFWQKTDQPTLMRRYGRPAFEIVHKSEEVEQQMYSELRQRESSGSVFRSASAASYGSGSGIGVNGGGLAQY